MGIEWCGAVQVVCKKVTRNIIPDYCYSVYTYINDHIPLTHAFFSYEHGTRYVQSICILAQLGCSGPLLYILHSVILILSTGWNLSIHIYIYI